MIAAWVLERLGPLVLVRVLMAIAVCHLATVTVTWAVARQAGRLQAEAQ
jgi:hypothetical protein